MYMSGAKCQEQKQLLKALTSFEVELLPLMMKSYSSLQNQIITSWVENTQDVISHTMSFPHMEEVVAHTLKRTESATIESCPGNAKLLVKCVGPQLRILQYIPHHTNQQSRPGGLQNALYTFTHTLFSCFERHNSKYK